MCTGSLTELHPGSHSLTHTYRHTHTHKVTLTQTYQLTNKQEPHVYPVADRVVPRLSLSLSHRHKHHTHTEWHSHKLTHSPSDHYLHPPPYLLCASGTAGTADLWGEARTQWGWAGWEWGTWGGGVCRCGDCARWWRTHRSPARPRAQCSHPPLPHTNTETRKMLLIKWAYVNPSSNAPTAFWRKYLHLSVSLTQLLWNPEAE